MRLLTNSIKVRKRDNRLTSFNRMNIYNAIMKACIDAGRFEDSIKDEMDAMSARIEKELIKLDAKVLTISMIQSQVEHALIYNGYADIAAAYIEYRLQRDFERAGLSKRIKISIIDESVDEVS